MRTHRHHGVRLCLAVMIVVGIMIAAPSARSSEIESYEAEQNPQTIDPRLHSLNEYLSETDEVPPLGMKLRMERRALESGKEVEGLLIVDITPGSPAAAAGLRANSQTARNILQGAAVVATLVFPPAMLAIPIAAAVPLGETDDLIIAVDASRVSNFLDFENQMSDVQPGEIVYFTIIRKGRRLQVPVPVPGLAR